MRGLPEVWCRILPEAFETPAVDVQRDAGDEAGALGAEERDGIGQLVRTAPASQRVLARGEPSSLILVRDSQLRDEAGHVAMPHAGIDPAGAHGINEDVVRPELAGQRLR